MAHRELAREVQYGSLWNPWHGNGNKKDKPKKKLKLFGTVHVQNPGFGKALDKAGDKFRDNYDTITEQTRNHKVLLDELQAICTAYQTPGAQLEWRVLHPPWRGARPPAPTRCPRAAPPAAMHESHRAWLTLLNVAMCGFHTAFACAVLSMANMKLSVPVYDTSLEFSAATATEAMRLTPWRRAAKWLWPKVAARKARGARGGVQGGSRGNGAWPARDALALVRSRGVAACKRSNEAGRARRGWG